MSQSDELEFQGGAATKPEGEYGSDGGKNRDHARDGRAVARKSPTFLTFRSFEQAQRTARNPKRLRAACDFGTLLRP